MLTDETTRRINRGHASQASHTARKEATQVLRIIADGGTLDDARLYLNTAGTLRVGAGGALQTGTWTIAAVEALVAEATAGADG